MGRPPIGERPLTGSERVKRYRERRRKGERSERQLSDAEKLALARREVRDLQRRLRHSEQKNTDLVHRLYMLEHIDVAMLQRALAEHGIVDPTHRGQPTTKRADDPTATMSTHSLRAHCIRKQRLAADYAEQARKLVARYRWHQGRRDGIPQGKWLGEAALAQQGAAEQYAAARAALERLVEAERRGGVP